MTAGSRLGDRLRQARPGLSDRAHAAPRRGQARLTPGGARPHQHLAQNQFVVEPAFEMYAACAQGVGLQRHSHRAGTRFPISARGDSRGDRAATRASSTSPIRTTRPVSRFLLAPLSRLPQRPRTRSCSSTRPMRSSAGERSSADTLDRHRNLDRRPHVREGARPRGAARRRAGRASGHARAASAAPAAVQLEHRGHQRARRGARRPGVSRLVRRPVGRVSPAALRRSASSAASSTGRARPTSC